MAPELQSGALIREMLAIEAAGRSGTLEVRAEGVVTFVYFKQGRAIFAEEGTLGATLGRTVLEAGLITPEQYAKVVERMTDGLIECEQMRLGEVLVELRYMSGEAVHQTLADDVRRNIIRAAASLEPTWTFQQDVLPGGIGRFPVPIGPCVLEAVRLHFGPRRIEAVLAPARDRFGLLRSSVDAIGTRFRLSPAEFKVVGLLDGRRATGSFTAGPELDPRPVIATLLLVGDLVLADARAASVHPPPAHPAPVSTRVTGSFRATSPAARSPSGSSESVALGHEGGSAFGGGARPQTGSHRAEQPGGPASVRGPASTPFPARTPSGASPPPTPPPPQLSSTHTPPPPSLPLRGTGPRLSAQMRAATAPPSVRPVTGPRQTLGPPRTPTLPGAARFASPPPPPASRPGLGGGSVFQTGPRPQTPGHDAGPPSQAPESIRTGIRRPSKTAPRIDSPIPASPEEARRWADEAFERGKQLVRSDQVERALPELRRASRVRTDAETAVYIAWAELREGDPDETRARKAQLKRLAIAAVREDRGFAFGYYVIGQLALMDGDESAAEQAFKVAHKLDPAHTDAERNLRIITRRRTGPRG